MKPYLQIPIQECGEPLVAIPTSDFLFWDPHPYQVLGAPYGEISPYHLRQGVVAALQQAQATLAQHQPDWRMMIFDAYRPVAVQQFMVNYTFAQALQARNLKPEAVTEPEQQSLWQEVYKLWAVPSTNPLTPPPHSTGAAIDVTLADAKGCPVDMGSDIDELSERSHPDYFVAIAADPGVTTEARTRAGQAHANRQLLAQVMAAAGFQRHLDEWWHFSLGDQMWAWLHHLQGNSAVTARYGPAHP